MNIRNIFARRIGALVLAAICTPFANATTILSPSSIVAGQSVADWTAAWWTWVLQAPAAQNPLTDSSGQFANVNNNGPVFFVAGSNGYSGPVNRAFVVPVNRPLLLPMINFFDTEPLILDGGAALADRQNAANVVVGSWLNSVETASLFASIDGAAVSNPSQYLQVSGLFSAGPTLAGSFAESLGVGAGDVLDPTKSGGYWLMVDGLALGSHTLHFGGSSKEFTIEPNCCTNGTFSAFSQDNTISITVVPEPSSAWMLLAGMVALSLRRVARVGSSHAAGDTDSRGGRVAA
jgi:hypothetical protein